MGNEFVAGPSSGTATDFPAFLSNDPTRKAKTGEQPGETNIGLGETLFGLPTLCAFEQFSNDFRICLEFFACSSNLFGADLKFRPMAYSFSLHPRA